jgi:hypothetical protein
LVAKPVTIWFGLVSDDRRPDLCFQSPTAIPDWLSKRLVRVSRLPNEARARIIRMSRNSASTGAGHKLIVASTGAGHKLIVASTGAVHKLIQVDRGGHHYGDNLIHKTGARHQFLNPSTGARHQLVCCKSFLVYCLC